MIKSICPICNKAGLPDYTKVHTVCPQCNSDLKPFFLLYSIIPSSPKKVSRLVLLLVLFVPGALIILNLNLYSKLQQLEKQKEITINKIQDSIPTSPTTISVINTVHSDLSSPPAEIIIQYKVKKGDTTSKIARFFYNDWKMYKQIEEDNNLVLNNILQVGQLLTIKLSNQ